MKGYRYKLQLLNVTLDANLDQIKDAKWASYETL